MERRLGMASRRELVRAVGERYRAGTRAAKRSILDEFVAVTGYHRKHAIRLLRGRENGSIACHESPTTTVR